MKANPPAGKYTVAVNGGKSTTFTISNGDVAVAGCKPAERLKGTYSSAEYRDEKYVSIGFKITDITFADWKAFTTVKTLFKGEEEKVVSTAFNKIIQWEDTANIADSTTITCAIQVDWVPGDLADKFNLYLSTDTE